MIFIFVSLLLLITLYLYKMTICSTFEEQCNYLSIRNTCQIKGLFALLILLHHLCQLMYNDFGLLNMGPLGVSVFFFFSGYGLLYKIMNDSTYMDSFISKRVVKLFIPFICIYFLEIFINYLEGTTYSFIDILKSFVNGCPIAMWLWYVIFLLFFYLFFWTIFKVVGRKPLKIIGCSMIFLTLWCVFCFWRRFSPSWTLSCYAIVLGMFWMLYKEKISRFISQYYYLMLLLPFALCIVFHYIYTVVLYPSGWFFGMLASLLFVISIIVFNFKFQNRNIILSFLGKISFELYILHPVVVNFLRGKIIYIQSDTVYFLSGMVISVILAWLLYLAINVRKIIATANNKT